MQKIANQSLKECAETTERPRTKVGVPGPNDAMKTEERWKSEAYE